MWSWNKNVLTGNEVKFGNELKVWNDIEHS